MRIVITPRRQLVSVIVSTLVVILLSGGGLARASAEPATGGRLWVSTYAGPENGLDNANAMVTSPEGSVVFVTGFSDGQEQDYATVAYDAATGNGLWASRYDGGHRDDNAYAIAVSPDGSAIFVTGTSDRRGTGDDYATVAYDSVGGSLLWVSRYTGPADATDSAYAIGVSPDGATVFVTGASSRPGASTQDYATVAYDAASGKQLWVSRNGGVRGDDSAFALEVSPDGSSVFVTGQSDYDVATVAYDTATGAGLWNARYDDPSHDTDSAFALGTSPDGSVVFLTGYGGPDYLTIAYDAVTGQQRWVSIFNGRADQSDGAAALGVSPDGSRVFVTGSSYQVEGGIDSDYVTLAYDAATGGQLWQARFTGPGHHDDIPYALGVSPDGSTVFAAGWTTARGNQNDVDYDYAAVAYDTATGTQRGVARLDSGYDDLGYAVAVTPDGSELLMTGRVGLGGDFGTVAFGLTP